MILDMRGLDCMDAFNQVSDAAAHLHMKDEEIDVFVDADEFEKCMIIKGFIENFLGYNTSIAETSGYYILKVSREAHVTAGKKV